MAIAPAGLALLMLLMSAKLAMATAEEDSLEFSQDFLFSKIKKVMLNLPVAVKAASNGTLKRQPASPSKQVSQQLTTVKEATSLEWCSLLTLDCYAAPQPRRTLSCMLCRRASWHGVLHDCCRPDMFSRAPLATESQCKPKCFSTCWKDNSTFFSMLPADEC